MDLTAKQRALAELLVLQPKTTNEEIAKQIKIDIKTLYKWKKTDEFQEYMSECYKKRFRDLEGLAIEKLKENIDNNCQKAIEYTLNYLGYKPVEKQEVEMAATIEIDYGEEDSTTKSSI